MGKKDSRRNKNQNRSHRTASGDIEVTRARIPNKEDNEILGIVTQILGNERMQVRCADGKQRMGRIRGKIKKRMWVRLGDLVLVVPWEELGGDRCDIVHRYRNTEAAWLERKGFYTDYLKI
nr:translation initiation factor eIF-1A [Candidatus Sigynarchaeota archaeon]